MKTNPNEPVFPRTQSESFPAAHGLTKREEFAKAAMQALIARPEHTGVTDTSGKRLTTEEDGICAVAVMFADGLIAALNKESR